MNTAAQMVCRFIRRDEYEHAAEALHKHGRVIGVTGWSTTFYALGDAVFCQRSVTQIEYAGQLSSEPRFRAPEHFHEVEEVLT